MNITIKDLDKFYGSKDNRVQVLNHINCEIKDGEICVLLGPSGSGKSTLLNIIGGLETAEGGEVNIDGKIINKMKKSEVSKYRRDSLGFVFQFYNLIPDLTVKENIEVCEYLSDNPLDLMDLIETLGLTPHKDKFPSQLSGGQQQRCAIGRALIKNPGILLCDEPTGALDYKTSKELLVLIEEIHKKYNNTILIVTHNEAIKNMANRVMKLHDGQITSSIENTDIMNAADIEW